MGTLSDITANANILSNRQLRSAYSKVEEALDTPASAKASSATPRFMSPTIASSQQGTPPSAQKGGHAFTPTATLSSKARSGSWMASAVRRVGISRMSDGPSRTKKESSLQKSKDVSVSDIPDKVTLDGCIQSCWVTEHRTA